MYRHSIPLSLTLGLLSVFTASTDAQEPETKHPPLSVQARPLTPTEILGSWSNGKGAIYTINDDATVMVQVKDLWIRGKYVYDCGTIVITYPEYDLVEVASLTRTDADAHSQLHSAILVTNIPGSKAGDQHRLRRVMEHVSETE